MKKLLIAILMIAPLSLNAQKFAHFNSADIIPNMKEYVTATEEIQAMAKQYDDDMKLMQEELQKKYTDYQERKAQMTELIRTTKEQELNDLNQRIQSYQQSAQQKLQEKEKELLQPIIDRAKQAISDVAKENGYTYIFDTSAGTLLYQQDSDDILPLVKKKLGLK